MDVIWQQKVQGRGHLSFLLIPFFFHPPSPPSLIPEFSIVCMSVILLFPIIGYLSLYMFWLLIIDLEHDPFGLS